MGNNLLKNIRDLWDLHKAHKANVSKLDLLCAALLNLDPVSKRRLQQRLSELQKADLSQVGLRQADMSQVDLDR